MIEGLKSGDVNSYIRKVKNFNGAVEIFTADQNTSSYNLKAMKKEIK